MCLPGTHSFFFMTVNDHFTSQRLFSSTVFWYMKRADLQWDQECPLSLLLGHLDVWFLNLGQNKGAGKSVLFWVYNLPQWPPGLVSLLMVCNSPKQFEKASWVLERAPESFFQGALPKAKILCTDLGDSSKRQAQTQGSWKWECFWDPLVSLHPLPLTAPHPLFTCVHWLEVLVSVSHVQNVNFRISSSCWSKI